MRPSAVAVLAGMVLACFSVWITREAKALEQDLDSAAQKVALLDKPAPDFHLTAVDGRTVSLADYHGTKKLVLEFWATWNNGSHPAMLMLSVFDKQYHASNDFDIVAVAVDDRAADVKQFVADSKIAFPVVLDQNRAVTNLFQVRSVPTTLIIEDGKVTWGAAGFAQGRQSTMAQKLGIRAGDFRMEMGAPRGPR